MNPWLEPAKQVAATVAKAEPLVIGLFYLFVTGVTLLVIFKLIDLIRGRKKKRKMFRKWKSKDPEEELLS